MRGSRRDLFTTVRSEGGLLPADFLQRLVGGGDGIEGISPDAYHLTGGEKLNEAASRAWNRLLGAWAAFQAASKDLKESDAGTGITREKWLLPFFQELGYGRLLVARTFDLEGKSYPISHGWNRTPIHLVGRNVDLDRRFPGVAGAAKVSPHGLVQEFLNRSSEHLWGFLSNGLRLRILRESKSLTRQAYVEFDLAGMMDGQIYADFALLWLVCHQSRVEADRPEQSWLERWSEAARAQGTRALEDLRKGVEKAIEALGRGFLANPGNASLREKLQSAALTKQDYYRQLLRTVYRLIFLFVAEDRDLLLTAGAGSVERKRYLVYYSVDRFRTLAERRRGSPHADLWQGLRLVFGRLSSDTGCPELGLPALGSFLWSAKATPDLDGCDLANSDLLDAVRALAFIVDRGIRRGIDYKNLGAEELGSVYESLLELHPDVNASAATFALTTAAGHERKTTGSYYTPSSLIDCLLDSALEPVLDEAAKKPDPEKAILNLKVCDPACGSGHFLIAAAHRIANRLAAIRTGDEEPPPEAVRKALRDVVGRCLYGVDLNPMAVELCKVNLWIEALEPGKPLSFLEHRIQCGNSLLGATPALLRDGIPDEAFEPIEGDDKEYCRKFKKENKKERTGQLRLIEHKWEPWQRLGSLATAIVELDAISDDTVQAQHAKQERWEQLVRSSGYEFGRLLADAWCATFVWKKAPDPTLQYPITEDTFRRIEKNPHWAPDWMKAEIRRLAAEYQFFHWHLAFPAVFRIPATGEEAPKDGPGWLGGFDVVLGNPPWIRQEFFRSLKRLLAVYPSFSSTADLSVFFLDRSLQITRLKGRVGLLTPNKWFRTEYAAPLRLHLRQHSRIHLIIDFGHSKTLFPSADTFPAAVVIEPSLGPAAEKSSLRFVAAPDHLREQAGLDVLVQSRAIEIPHANLTSHRWLLEELRVGQLIDRLTRTGIPLSQYVGQAPLFGIKTGLNQAFHIDSAKRDALVASDPGSERLLRKFLRGRDVQRWAVQWSGTWHILIPSSQNYQWPWTNLHDERLAEIEFARLFPAIHGHLKMLENELRARSDQGVYWWELRSCDYYAVFDKPKIVVGDMAWQSEFALDDSEALIADTAYVIPSSDQFLLAVLNSRLMWWIFSHLAQPAKDEARRYRGILGSLPVPADTEPSLVAEIARHSRELVSLKMAGTHPNVLMPIEEHLDSLIMQAFRLNEDDSKVLLESLPERDPLMLLGKAVATPVG